MGEQRPREVAGVLTHYSGVSEASAAVKSSLFFSLFFSFSLVVPVMMCAGAEGRFLSEFIEHFLGFHRDGTMCVSNDHNALKNFLGKLWVCLEVLFSAATLLNNPDLEML